jgi:hypothetical protein
MQKENDDKIELKESKYFSNSIPLMERGKYTPRSLRLIKIISIIFLGLGTIMIIFHIMNMLFWDANEPFFNGLLTCGLLLMMQGLNFNFYGIPGYEYVKINNDGIEVKNSYFARIRNIKREQIHNIEIQTLLIIISMKDNNKEKIDLSWATYNNVHLIKERIHKYAGDNKIPVA